MAILVSCPGCKKSFNVDDKFAGKTGPCPHCKTKITVPQKQAEVKVHAPDEFAGGGKSTTGKLLLKPIARQQTRIKPLTAAAIGGGIIAAIAYAVAVRTIAADPGSMKQFVLCGLGLLLVAPPLAVLAYAFLRDDELEPYRGIALWTRAAICGSIYAILWGIFAYVRVSLFRGEPLSLPMWIILVPPFLIVGGLAAKLSLDVEPASGFFHYAFYVAVTVALAFIAGVSGAIWT